MLSRRLYSLPESYFSTFAVVANRSRPKSKKVRLLPQSPASSQQVSQDSNSLLGSVSSEEDNSLALSCTSVDVDHPDTQQTQLSSERWTTEAHSETVGTEIQNETVAAVNETCGTSGDDSMTEASVEKDVGWMHSLLGFTSGFSDDVGRSTVDTQIDQQSNEQHSPSNLPSSSTQATPTLDYSSALHDFSQPASRHNMSSCVTPSPIPSPNSLSTSPSPIPLPTHSSPGHVPVPSTTENHTVIQLAPAAVHRPFPSPISVCKPPTASMTIYEPAPIAAQGTPPAPVATYGTPPVPTATCVTPPVPTATYYGTPPVPTATNGTPPVPTATKGTPPAPVATHGTPSVPTATCVTPPVPTATCYGTPPVPTATNGTPPASVATYGTPPVPTATCVTPPVPTATYYGTPPVPTATNGTPPAPMAIHRPPIATHRPSPEPIVTCEALPSTTSIHELPCSPVSMYEPLPSSTAVQGPPSLLIAGRELPDGHCIREKCDPYSSEYVEVSVASKDAMNPFSTDDKALYQELHSNLVLKKNTNPFITLSDINGVTTCNSGVTTCNSLNEGHGDISPPAKCRHDEAPSNNEPVPNPTECVGRPEGEESGWSEVSSTAGDLLPSLEESHCISISVLRQGKDSPSDLSSQYDKISDLSSQFDKVSNLSSPFDKVSEEEEESSRPGSETKERCDVSPLPSGVDLSLVEEMESNSDKLCLLEDFYETEVGVAMQLCSVVCFLYNW